MIFLGLEMQTSFLKQDSSNRTKNADYIKCKEIEKKFDSNKYCRGEKCQINFLYKSIM